MIDENVTPEVDEAEDDAAGPSSSARTPPYIGFKTFLTFLGELKTNGLPPQIDRSVLRRFAGGLQNQLKMATRSMGLLDGAKPTPELAALVDAYETPEFARLLTKRLHTTYPYVFQLDLMTATPTMFADSFKVTGAKEDVLRKCRTFFLHAAKHAGIPLGQRLLTGGVPRSPSGTGRKRAAKAPANSPPAPPSPHPVVHTANGSATPKAPNAYELLAVLDMSDMDDAEQNAVFTLIRYLKKKEIGAPVAKQRREPKGARSAPAADDTANPPPAPTG